ncbi:MAG: 30S ribosomal protein S27ae [Candidatus Thermoplasmatota archaeon]|jgi:small subunit ribosomal protein S27Ae|nr:30S ribosomal protein S27ae [Candidatus Thermoplasmatota archaeon]MCL5785090.1 30S ribosomal protein S27ae [Candidatus Thermoplasmatota archaeon]
MLKRELYEVDQDKIKRGRRFCPKCGPGVFLADHNDRYTCGKCRYTEFKKQSKPKEEK